MARIEQDLHWRGWEASAPAPRRQNGRSKVWPWLAGFLPACLILTASASAAPYPASLTPDLRTFPVRGTVTEIAADGRTVVVRHEAISNFMAAMTMPFAAKEPEALAALRPDDVISFRLSVTPTDSWIDRIIRLGREPLMATAATRRPTAETAQANPKPPSLLDCQFTNELGQTVSLGEFRGQALAITFFYTRCPIPNYCPRLSKNFQEASRTLGALAGSPTNWHFLSISFDPEFDTPPVLKTYGEQYGYDPRHWSFLTGPSASIAELARRSGVEIERVGGVFTHNFRTIILDPAGHLQTVFPMGGDLSDAIVGEIQKAAVATETPVAPSSNAPAAAPEPQPAPARGDPGRSTALTESLPE